MDATGRRTSDSPKLEIRLLGRFEVLLDGEPIPKRVWGRQKTKTLLKVLLTDPGRAFTRDQLVDALFGGKNAAKAKDNLYGRISELRRALEPGLEHGTESAFIIREGQGYRFSTEANVVIDTLTFQREVKGAQDLATKKDWIHAAERFDQALSLYHGELLPADRYEEWAEALRSELREQHLDALTQLAECYEQLGRIRQAIACCQQILSLQPHRESIVRKLMAYQIEAGQRAQALEAYHAAVRVLREYLGVEPAEETQALFAQLSQGRTGEPEALDPRRIAVLPFVNFGPDPEDDYLADGMTEELIGHLSRIRDLRVVARTSVMRFRDTGRPVAAIARELSVGTLLEGSVRRAGEQIRVSTQLIDAGSEEHMWASEYNGPIGKLLTFQQDVARRVARSLQVVLFRDEAVQPARSKPRNPEAYSLYLKGRFFMSRGTSAAYAKALPLFERAIALDPQLAPPYVGVAAYYQALAGWEDAQANKIPLAEGYARLRHALLKALTIDPGLAVAHARPGCRPGVLRARSRARRGELQAGRPSRSEPSGIA